MRPSALNKDQVLKVAKTAAYIAASAVIGYLLTLATDNQAAFGIYWPVVNVVLVTLKQLFTTPKD